MFGSHILCHEALRLQSFCIRHVPQYNHGEMKEVLDLIITKIRVHTFMIYDFTQDEEEEKPSTTSNEEEEPDENHCSVPSPNHASLESLVVCNSDATNSMLDANGFLEDSGKKDEIMKDPASPLPYPSEYVPDTPVVSLFEITDKDDGDNAKKPIAEQIGDTLKTPIVSSVELRGQNQSQNENYEYVPDTPVVSLFEITDKDDGENAEKPIAEQIGDTLKTPIISPVEVREQNQLQNENCEYVPETPIISSVEVGEQNQSQNENCEYVLETASIPSALEVLPNTNCEKIEKCVLLEANQCVYVPESPILPPDQSHSKEIDGTETEQVGMQIDKTTKEVLKGESEGSISIVIDPGTMDAESARVSSGDIVISDNDDEGSGDKDRVMDEMPRKKRRRVAVLPEGPRRVTRSSLRGSNL